MTQDTFDLQRFLDAQEPVLQAVYSELKAGRKQTHWMWFIFPQIAGLGASSVSVHYAISGADEAEAYLNNPVLGQRLLHVCKLLMEQPNDDAKAIFGFPDVLKLKSSMTLFAAIAEDPTPFTTVLERFFNGEVDDATLRLMRQS